MLAFRKPTFVATAICSLLVGTAPPVSAKRSAPGVVEPVTVSGVTFSAPGWPIGIVIATDASSNRELWRQRIYAVRYDRTLEQDVQDVFITSLKLRGNVLVITNERGERFLLDLSTRKVTRANSETVRERGVFMKDEIAGPPALLRETLRAGGR
jgi:hypothetical protein